MKQLFTPFATVPKYMYLATAFIWGVLALCIWELAPELIPGPIRVGQQLVAFLREKDFYQNIIASMLLTSEAMLFSILIATLLAYLHTLPFFSVITGFLTKMRYLTLTGFLFAFLLILKSGHEVKLSVLMFGIIPYFILSLLSVIERVEQKEYDLCRTLKYNRWQTLYELIIVGRLDATIETIRANFAMAWLMITIVESFSMSEGGIGVMLFRFNKYNQLDKIFALQIVILCLGLSFDFLLARLRYFLFPYIKLGKK